MKKHIRICQMCGNTFETDDQCAYCNSCVSDILKEAERLEQEGDYKQLDKFIREL